MEITTDVILKGEVWERVLNTLQPAIFKTQYGVYVLCVAIGIMYDKQTDPEKSENDEQKYIPRTMLFQKTAELEILFQTAILTTDLVDYSEDKRLELAFGNKIKDFNQMQFLTKYANYGVTILDGKISDDPLETMENIKDFVTSTFEGTNFEIDPLKDEDVEITSEDLD